MGDEAGKSSLQGAVVVDGARVAPWQSDCIKRLQSLASGKRLVIVRLPPAQADSGCVVSWLLGDRAPTIPLEALGVPVVAAGSIGEAGALLRQHGADFALNLSAHDLVVPLAEGTWRFFLGDTPLAPAFVAGLSEMLADQATASLTLVRFTDRGADVLGQGRFRVYRWSHRHTTGIPEKSAPALLARACRRLSLAPSLPADNERWTGAARKPGNYGGRVAARLALVMATNWLRTVYQDFVLWGEWNVGICSRSAASVLEAGALGGVAWLPPPRAYTFLADPAGMATGTGGVVLAEEMSLFTAKGRIVGGALEGSLSQEALSPVVENDAHLSFPVFFQVAGHIHMSLEAYEDFGVTLYRRRSDDFLKWEPVARILDGMQAVDPVMFEHGGRWWLLCTDQADGPNLHLHAFYAEDPFGPWHPHALNPVLTDIAGARPAGPVFAIGDRLFRPAQDCSRGYGCAVYLKEIVALDPWMFEEKAFLRLAPSTDGPYNAGLHTFYPIGDKVLIDGKRMRLLPLTLPFRLLNKFRNSRRRMSLAARRGQNQVVRSDAG